jgi:hypothetical protein
MGILYFIQPAELVGTNRFKVGCSTKNDLSRVKSYKVGTRMIMILQCEDPFGVEQKVIQEFNTRFHKIAGNEYFEGVELDMRKVFYETYLQWEQHDAIIAQLKTLISHVKKCIRKIEEVLYPEVFNPYKAFIHEYIIYVESDSVYLSDLKYQFKNYYSIMWGAYKNNMNNMFGQLLQTIMENSNVYEKNGKVYGIKFNELNYVENE